MSINEIFFELIRVAIGTQNTLSRPPSKGEWAELYAMAKKQSLVGICFAGLQRLYNEDNQEPSTHNPKLELTQNQEPRTQNLDEVLYLTWMGMAAKIQQRNEVVNRQCVELQAKLSAEGIRSSILKGQGVAALYRVHDNDNCRPGGSMGSTGSPTINKKPSTINLQGLRQSGDIDIYVDCGREKAIEYARSVQGDVDWDYKHLHLNVFPDPSTGSGQATEVEVHYVPEVISNLWTNRKLRKWYGDSKVSSSMFQVQGGMVTPSVEFNLVYILLHAYRHFLYEGVGLRQLMDYYFVLRTSYDTSTSLSTSSDTLRYDNDNFVSLIKRFGMMQFAKGVMWIMQNVFANDGSTSLTTSNDDLFLGIKPDEKEGRYILNEVMRGGNFGHHDERLKSDGKGNWKVEDVKRRLRHAWHLFWHYPGEVIWSPVYIVWHKAWVILHRR